MVRFEIEIDGKIYWKDFSDKDTRQIQRWEAYIQKLDPNYKAQTERPQKERIQVS